MPPRIANHAFNSFHPSPNLVLFCLPSAVPNTNATGAGAHACARVRSLSPPNSRTLVPSPSVSTRIIHQARIVRTSICTPSSVIAFPSSLAVPSSCHGFGTGYPHLIRQLFLFLFGWSVVNKRWAFWWGSMRLAKLFYVCTMMHDVITARPGFKVNGSTNREDLRCLRAVLQFSKIGIHSFILVWCEN